MPDNPYQLVGQTLLYKVVIHKVKNLPNNFCKNLRIEYHSFYERSTNYTKIYNQNENKKCEFDIGEEFEHKIDYITKEDVDFLQKEDVKFKIYAYEEVEKKGKIKIDEKKADIQEEDNIKKSNTKKNEIKPNIINNYFGNDEPDEPTEFINKNEGQMKIIEDYYGINKNKKENQNNEKVRGRSGSQKFRKLNKDKDCSIY